MKYFLVGTLLELSFLLLSTVHAIPAAITAKAVLPAIDKRGPIFSSSVDRKEANSNKAKVTDAYCQYKNASANFRNL